jgi:PST family polysaccharide transporter
VTAEADRLGRIVLGGTASMLVARYAGTLSVIAATAVMARFISPEEYGLVTAAVATMAVARVLEEVGLGEVIVQRKHISDGQCSALFWINLAFGTACTIAGVAISPLVATFFGRPELAWIFAALSLNFLIAALGSQHRALLRRSFRFRAIAIGHAAALAGGSAIGVLLAARGAGPWAIVGHNIGTSVFLLVSSWVASGWWPGPPRRVEGLRSMLRFGGLVAASQAIASIGRNLDSILIGKFVGLGPLGAYDRAFQLMVLPATQFNIPFNSAAVPALSRLQHEPEAFRRLYLRLCGVVAAIASPIAVFTAAAAPAIVATLLGPAWEETATLLRLLAPSGLVLALNPTIRWVYLPLGRVGRLFRWVAFSTVVLVAAMVAGLPWGAAGVAIGLGAAHLALWIPSLMYAYSGTFLRLGDLGRVMWPPPFAAAAAGALAFAVDPAEHAAPLRLLAQGGCFLATYAVLFRMLPGGHARFTAIRKVLRGDAASREDDA